MFDAMKTTGLAGIMTVGLVGFAAPALAQSYTSPFDGPYAGVGLGLSDFDYKMDDQDVGDTDFAYQALVGYRQTLQSGLIAGLEGHIGASDAKDDVTVDIGGGEDYTGTTSLGRSLGIDAIFGKTFGRDGRFLGFVSAGYLNQKVEACCIVADVADGVVNVQSVGDTESGYRFGVGFEAKLMNNMAWRATVHYGDTGRVDQTQAMTGITVGF